MSLMTDPRTGLPLVGLRTSDDVAAYLDLEGASEEVIALAMLALEEDGMVKVVNVITLEDGRKVYAFLLPQQDDGLLTGLYL